MKYAIIGSGNIGTALARVFAQSHLEVALANSRGPETLAALTKPRRSSGRASSKRSTICPRSNSAPTHPWTGKPLFENLAKLD